MAFLPPPTQYYSLHMLSNYALNEDDDDQLLPRPLPPHTTVASGSGGDDLTTAMQASPPSSFPPPPHGSGYQYDGQEFDFDSNYWSSSSLYPLLSPPSSCIINTRQGIQEGDYNNAISSNFAKEDEDHHHHDPQHDDHHDDDDYHHHVPAAAEMMNKGIGIIRYSEEERKDRILRYLKKRHHRNFNKTIKVMCMHCMQQYACRKTLADKRVRVRGRFAKNDHICGGGSGGHERMKDDIIDDDHHDHQTGDLYHYYHHHQFQAVHGVMAKLQDEEDEWLEEAITNLMYNTP